jgi:cytochrome P450
VAELSAAEPRLISDPAAYVAGVPHDEFARLRREAPVAWVEEQPLWRSSAAGTAMAVRGTGYWALTRHATIVAASRDTEAFSSAARGSFLADPRSRQDLERTRQFLINMDAPEHRRLRQLLSAAFTPRTLRLLEGAIRVHARSLVDGLLRREQFDVVRDLAAELPLLSLADLLGVPHEDRGLLYEWSNNLVGFDDPDLGAGRIDVYKRTFVDAFAYALELAAARRRQPGNDLISELVRDAGAGMSARMTDQEYCHLWLLLVVAGNETTRHLISGGLHALVEWPDQRRLLVERPDLLPTAVEELLRWVSPIMQFRRTAARDVEIEGQPVRAGDKVVMYYVSANRDETAFDRPDRLDLARSPNPHLAFGIGPHFCLGAHLARLEAAVLLETILPHLARLRLAGPVVRLESNFMNAVKSMPARFAEADDD